jgi:hypothetical protein
MVAIIKIIRPSLIKILTGPPDIFLIHPRADTQARPYGLFFPDEQTEVRPRTT